MANALMGNLNGTSGVDPATTVSGVNTAAAGAPFVAPAGVTVRITGGSLAAPMDIALNSAYATTALAIGDLTAKVNGNAQLNAAGISVSGAAGGALTFTDASGEIFSVEATGDTANALGLGSFVAGATSVDYATIQGTAYDNTVSAGIAHLEFSISGGPPSPFRHRSFRRGPGGVSVFPSGPTSKRRSMTHSPPIRIAGRRSGGGVQRKHA